MSFEISEQKKTLTELQNYYLYNKWYTFCKSNIQFLKYIHNFV